MATAAAPLATPETRVVLRGVSWDTYVRLNDEVTSPAVRCNFHNGTLEIMTVSKTHEGGNRLISDLFSNLAEGFEIEFRNTGSVTHRDITREIGFEPDTSFFTTRLDEVDALTGPIELPGGPAPDLIVEVDISTISHPKMELYAAVGCREGWRFDGESIHIYALSGTGSHLVQTSQILPGVSASDLTELLQRAHGMMRIKWAPMVRDWARTRRAEPGS